MAIKISNNNYLEWAQKALLAGDNYKSLSYLNRADNYESALNAFGVLLVNDQFYNANKQFEYLLNSYSSTHNVYTDVFNCFEKGKVSEFSNNFTRVDESCHNYKNKKNANSELIFDELKEADYSLAESLAMQLDELSAMQGDDGQLQAGTIKNVQFFGTKSAEYVAYLNEQMIRSMENNEFAKAYELFDKAIEVDCDILEVLIWKVDVLAVNKMYDRALPFAEKIYDKLDSALWISVVAETIAQGCGNKQMLRHCIDQLLAMKGDVPPDRFYLMMRLCTDFLFDSKLASQFALYISQHQGDFKIDELKDSARILLIAGEKAVAKKLLSEIVLVANNDVWAKVMLWHCVDIDGEPTLKDLAPMYYSHYALPRNSIFSVMEYLDENCNNVDSKYLDTLLAIIQHSSIVVRGESKVSLHDLIISIIIQSVITEENYKLFTAFARNVLACRGLVVDILAVVLAKLSLVTSHTTVFIRHKYDHDKLNVDIFDCCSDDYAMLLTMCTCAILGKMTNKLASEFSIYYRSVYGENSSMSGVDCTIAGYNFMLEHKRLAVDEDVITDIKRMMDMRSSTSKVGIDE